MHLGSAGSKHRYGIICDQDARETCSTKFRDNLLVDVEIFPVMRWWDVQMLVWR